MSSVVVAGNTSGSVTLSAPDVAGSVVVTLPSASGTMAVNGPAFSAYSSAAQSIPNAVSTKLTYDTEEFDTNNNFASSRFTPTVAGYYQINAVYSSLNSTSARVTLVSIFKNGSEFKRGTRINTTDNSGINVSSIIYLNGSTDYVEIYAFQSSGVALNTEPGAGLVWVNGALARAA